MRAAERVLDIGWPSARSSIGLPEVSLHRDHAPGGMLTDLIETMNLGDHTLLNILDLSAVFDMVDRGILVERLFRTYGVCSVSLDWISSYLRGRRQTVFFKGVSSSVRLLLGGVPLGFRARAFAVLALHC